MVERIGQGKKRSQIIGQPLPARGSAVVNRNLPQRQAHQAGLAWDSTRRQPFAKIILQYICNAVPTCLRWKHNSPAYALRLAAASAGSSIAARMAMMAMTTSNSINVNPETTAEEFINGRGRLRSGDFYLHFGFVKTLTPPKGNKSSAPLSKKV